MAGSLRSAGKDTLISGDDNFKLLAYSTTISRNLWATPLCVFIRSHCNSIYRDLSILVYVLIDIPMLYNDLSVIEFNGSKVKIGSVEHSNSFVTSAFHVRKDFDKGNVTDRLCMV